MLVVNMDLMGGERETCDAMVNVSLQQRNLRSVPRTTLASRRVQAIIPETTRRSAKRHGRHPIHRELSGSFDGPRISVQVLLREVQQWLHVDVQELDDGDDRVGGTLGRRPDRRLVWVCVKRLVSGSAPTTP